MARFEVKLPKMGESVAEATITSWLKNVGDTVELDEAIVEIATDKVDSEVPSEVEGTLVEILFNVDAVVNVGETIAIIETLSDDILGDEKETLLKEVTDEAITIEKDVENVISATTIDKVSASGKFFSPLVRNIAETEGISMEELEAIVGTGKDNRVTKNDIFAYLESGRKIEKPTEKVIENMPLQQKIVKDATPTIVTPVSVNGEDEIIEMSRMGKLIAHHMVTSTQTSAHVQSFIEVDVTNIVKWRNKIKDQFFAREGEKITYTPIFMQAVAKAIKDFPMINIAVDGDKIIKKKAINLGMAAALADG
ncbi:2-oxo acid dehydrogenase subunit E2, partial [Lutibacter sp.]